MKKHLIFPFIILSSILITTGCVKGQSQNQYLEDEVGTSRTVTFATIIQSRPVGITGKSTGTGALAGGAVGAGSGAYIGNGSGSVWAMAGGAVIGAVAGAAAEQAAKDRGGIEYVLTKENGKTITIVQELGEGERIFNNGERVMIQTSGSYQRVLPAQQLPTAVARPKGITVIDDPKK